MSDGEIAKLTSGDEDDVVFEVPKKVAMMSVTVKNFIEGRIFFSDRPPSHAVLQMSATTLTESFLYQTLPQRYLEK